MAPVVGSRETSAQQSSSKGENEAVAQNRCEKRAVFQDALKRHYEHANLPRSQTRYCG